MIFSNRTLNTFFILLSLLIFSGCVTQRVNTETEPTVVLEFKLGSFEEFSGAKSYVTNDYDRRVYLHDQAVLDARHITSSEATLDRNLGSEYLVLMELDQEGTRLLAEITEQNQGKVLAILVDDQLIIAPIIHGAILHGTFMISGLSSKEEATDLHLKIQQAIRSYPH